MVFASNFWPNVVVAAVQLICRKSHPNKVTAIQNKYQSVTAKIIYAFFAIVFTGWDKIETIDSLLRKGGYRGHISPDVRDAIKLTRYQSSETHLPYDEYRELAERRQSKSNGFF